MSSNEIINTLKAEKPLLSAQFGVEEIGVFGSSLNANFSDDSDIDIIVTLRNIDYSAFAGLQIYLENKFKRKIDLIRKGKHLSAKFYNSIQNQIVYA